MLKPSEVKETAKKLESQNIRFRRFLKNHADSDQLDAQFLELHMELFSVHDCSRCRNCCKVYDASLEGNEIKRIAEFLGQDESELIREYLIQTDEGRKIKGRPCCFLQADGQCRIQECRPSSCRDFPFTDKPERLFSLLSVLESAEVCPVVFEILERLKEVYGFRNNI